MPIFLTSRRVVRFALPALAAAVLARPGAAQRAERFELEGSRAAVHNLVGEMTVAAATGRSVVVEVTRMGDDAGRLSVNRSDDAVRVVYPENHVVYAPMGRTSRTQLSVRRDGSIGGGMGAHQVTVTGSGSGLRAYANVRVLVPAGRTVTVNQGVGRVEVSNVNGTLNVNTAAASVRAQGTRGALDVEVGSGSVEVRDAVGTVQVETGSGGVTASNVRGSTVDVETGSGSVHLNGVRVQTMGVAVGSGRVTLLGISAPDVTVETGSGSVQLELTRDTEDMKIDTGSGSVNVTVPAGFGGQLEIETGSGGIDVDLPVTHRRASRGSFNGTVGDGEGRVRIETGSGGVHIRRG
jgi:lia operon protein LiaG